MKYNPASGQFMLLILLTIPGLLQYFDSGDCFISWNRNSITIWLQSTNYPLFSPEAELMSVQINIFASPWHSALFSVCDPQKKHSNSFPLSIPLSPFSLLCLDFINRCSLLTPHLQRILVILLIWESDNRILLRNQNWFSSHHPLLSMFWLSLAERGSL